MWTNILQEISTYDSNFFLIFSFIINSYNLFEDLFLITKPFNSFCYSLAPNSKYQFFYQAIVCGKKLSVNNIKDIFIKFSLIHLIVVSGSHLIFLDFILHKIIIFSKKKEFIIFVLLFFYLLLVNLQAPVLRAFFSLILVYINKKNKLFWPQTYITLISGLITLALFPKLINSYSLILSWTAALSLAILNQFNFTKNLFIKNLFIYTFIFPVIILISSPHPWGISFNAIMAPIIGFFLFPISIIAYILPHANFLTDIIIDYILKILLLFDFNYQSKNLSFFLKNYFAYLWLYILSIHFFLHIINLYLKQKKIKQNDFSHSNII